MKIINKIRFTGKDYDVQDVINILEKYKHFEVVEDFEIAIFDNQLMCENERIVQEAYSHYPNQKINMIKYIRNNHGKPLKEAKELVGKYYDNCLPPDSP
jgi:ribosomal protein L7/L12